MATVQEALEAAFRLQGAGRLAEAALLYDRILAVCPDHADALHLSGIALRRLGDIRRGLQRIACAVALRPDSAELYNNLGNALRDRRQWQKAALLFGWAVRLKPALEAAHAGLAGTLQEMGRPAEALAVWQAASAALPDRAEVLNGLANALQAAERLGAAQTAYRLAIAVDPGFAAVYANLAAALRGAGQAAAAAGLQRRALRLVPDFPAALSGLGLALSQLDRPDGGAACHRRALALQPGFAGAQNNLGSALMAGNRLEAAVASFRRAVLVDPATPDPHRNLGIALLLQGRLGEGWPEYEWRFRCADSLTPAELPWPRWDGRWLDGRSILLHTEQGLGDILQFARYVPMVAARGGRVVLCAPKAVEALFASLSGVSRFVPAGTPLSPSLEPDIAVQCPLMSLPLLFGTVLDTIPARVPYLRPDPVRQAAWGARLAEAFKVGAKVDPFRIGPFKIGIVWAGSPGHGNDRNRSLSLAALAPLGRVPGVRLVSIQKGPPATAAETPPPGMEILNLSPEIDDFADTAAILSHLDLVVTVDTSVAHLAGALGVPVWVLLPFAPDWRWMLHRQDSPWYPTMRLFRQEAPGAWGPVLERAAHDLSRLIGSDDMPILVPVSWGELLDKITILDIKSRRIADAAKLANVRREREALDAVVAAAGVLPEAAQTLIGQLTAVNEALWDVEDNIRDCERAKDFGPRFVELARSVYRSNDRRAALKRELNDLLGSELVEEKSYQPY